MSLKIKAEEDPPPLMSEAPFAPKQTALARLSAAAAGGPVPVNRHRSAAARESAAPYLPRPPAPRAKIEASASASSSAAASVEAGGAGGAPKRDAAEIARETVRREREQSGGISARETKASRYTRRLQEGLNPTGNCHIPGIMSKKSVKGVELLPFEHQRHACSMACVKDQDVLLLAHDAGTGKTATFFQILAAMELVVGGGATAIVTCPPATLAQWEETAHDWLNLPDKRGGILVTNQAEKLTQQVLQRVRVLIITRHLLAKIYKTSWEWVKEHERSHTGHWMGAWVPKPGTPHPLFLKEWTLLGVDEAYALACIKHHYHPITTPSRLFNPILTYECELSQALHEKPSYRLVCLTQPIEQGHLHQR